MNILYIKVNHFFIIILLNIIYAKQLCMIGDHESKQIECVCIYEHCNLISRFLCAKCLKIENHKH